MKTLLIVVNLTLILLIVVVAIPLFQTGGDAAPALQAGKDRTKTAGVKTAVKRGESKNREAPTNATATQLLLRKNIFDLQRCPNAMLGRGGRGNSYMLVGVYRVGATRGAVILTRNAGRTVTQTTVNNPRASAANRAPATQNQAVKQFFRVGDTLPNGYTLSEIGTDKAVLVRGGTRMELKLALASENMPRSAGSAPRTGALDRLLNLMQSSVVNQQRGQMQMMQMMMRQNQQQNNARTAAPTAAGSGTAGTARRR